MYGPGAEELRVCGWGPYAREASVWEACCWYSGVMAGAYICGFISSNCTLAALIMGSIEMPVNCTLARTMHSSEYSKPLSNGGGGELCETLPELTSLRAIHRPIGSTSSPSILYSNRPARSPGNEPSVRVLSFY